MRITRAILATVLVASTLALVGPQASAAEDDYELLLLPGQVPPGNTGNVLHPNGERQWVSIDCRASLEAAGMPVRQVEFGELTAYPEYPDPVPSCTDILEAFLGPGIAPTADAGPDQIVLDKNGSGDAPAALDGTGSVDPDGTIDRYLWFEGETQIAAGPTPTVGLTVGTHVIKLEVTDDRDNVDTDTTTILVLDTAQIPQPVDTYVIVQARAGNFVEPGGFGFGAGNVTVNFNNPDGGPFCPTFVTKNGGGNPVCDLHPGWTATATRPTWPTAVVEIVDLGISGFDRGGDTVSVFVNNPNSEISFGCDGSVAVTYGADIDDGPSAIRMVPKSGNSTVDFSQPGPCASPLDDTTADVTDGDSVYLTAWDDDVDRTLDVRTVEAPFDCLSGAMPFNDAFGSFAFYDIKCLYELEITTGTSATTFSTGNYVTREQMAAFVARTLRYFGVEGSGAPHPFLDVPLTSYAYDDIALIYEVGITTGTSGTTYSPHDYVSREAMASFMARLYSVLHGSPSSPVLGLSVPTPFVDVSSSSFAYLDIRRIFGLGITTGTSRFTYSPTDHVTREAMAAFISRLVRILKFV